jgi:hypothetical protein
MDEVTYINGIIHYRGFDYLFEQTEKIDDMCVHVFMGEQVIALMGTNTIINGTVMTDADQIINTLNND